MAHTLRLMLSHCKNFKMCVARRAVCIDVYRCISTSKKNKDTTIPVQPVEIEQKSKELQELEEHFADQDIYSDKNWLCHGYDPTDPNYDTFCHNVTMFLTVTMLLCWGSFFLAYQPDHGCRDWLMRESFLELDRREKNGLPLISRDYVDPSLIELPSDEELQIDGVDVIV